MQAPQHNFSLPSDLESTAGSEWEDAGSSSGAQLGAVTKEQLFQMLQKTRSRYHKYKGRYVDVARAYTDLEAENQKVKNVMQQTQVGRKEKLSNVRLTYRFFCARVFEIINHCCMYMYLQCCAFAG